MVVSPIKPTIVPAIIVIAVLASTLLVAGCSSPFSGTAPTSTVAATYTPPPPTPTPAISVTPSPTPATSWNGYYYRLYGTVSVSSGTVLGNVYVNYLDPNFYSDNPSSSFDTAVGGNFSIDQVRGNVPFKVTLEYIYLGSLPEITITKLINQTYTITNDTQVDFTVMTNNVTPIEP